MPSRESVSEEVRARTEFATAVRQGIEALMDRCGYSRERATVALLKELNRGNGPESKPTDDETFDAMRRHKLGLDEANRAIVVSRAMRRELLNAKNTQISSTEAIQKLTSRLSLDNILYESGEDDSEDDCQNEILPLKIPKVSRLPSSSINRSSSTSTTSSTNATTNTTQSTSSSRKHIRSKKNASASPRKQIKAGIIRNNSGGNSNASNTIIVGRKRSIEEIDSTNKTSEVETKAATGRPQLRASKRLHRSSSSTEATVTATNK